MLKINPRELFACIENNIKRTLQAPNTHIISSSNPIDSIIRIWLYNLLMRKNIVVIVAHGHMVSGGSKESSFYCTVFGVMGVAPCRIWMRGIGGQRSLHLVVGFNLARKSGYIGFIKDSRLRDWLWWGKVLAPLAHPTWGNLHCGFECRLKVLMGF